MIVDKTRLLRIIENKPVTKIQNKWRIGLIVTGIILSIFCASFLLGLIFFDGNEYQKQGISPREIVKIEKQQSRELRQEFLKNNKKPNFGEQLEIVSLEFVLVLAALIILSMFLYRSTDWKLVKYPNFLVVGILLIVFLFGIIIANAFEQDRRIPKFVREKRFSSLILIKK